MEKGADSVYPLDLPSCFWSTHSQSLLRKEILCFPSPGNSLRISIGSACQGERSWFCKARKDILSPRTNMQICPSTGIFWATMFKKQRLKFKQLPENWNSFAVTGPYCFLKLNLPKCLTLKMCLYFFIKLAKIVGQLDCLTGGAFWYFILEKKCHFMRWNFQQTIPLPLLEEREPWLFPLF